MKASQPTAAYVLSVISGIAAGAVFAFGVPVYVLPVALALYFLVATSSSTSRAPDALKLTAIFFAAYYFVVLSWFLEVDTETLAGTTGPQVKLFLLVCLIIMTGVLTLVSTPFGYILHALRTKILAANMGAILTIASAWIVVEWLRSVAFALFLYAPGASIGDYWNFGSLGLATIHTPLGYASRFVGMYGLSFVVVILAVSTALAARKQHQPLLIMTCTVLVLSAAGVFLAKNEYLPRLEGSVLQADNSLQMLTDNHADIAYARDAKKHIVVLPEYSNVHKPENAAFAQTYAHDRLHDDGVVIDASDEVIPPQGKYNVLYARNKNGDKVFSQTKELLIPTGEYIPLVLRALYVATGQSDLAKSFENTRRLERGDPPQALETRHATIASVACSGILGRNIYRQLVRNGSNVLTNSASLLVFSESKSYFRQSLQMARLHAVANQRTYVQASKGAPAFVIDSDGSFIVAPDTADPSFIDFEFSLNYTTTLYTRLGDWPLAAAVLACTFFLTQQLRQRAKLRRKSLPLL